MRGRSAREATLMGRTGRRAGPGVRDPVGSMDVVQLYRRRTASAVFALFVALLVIATPMADRDRPIATSMGSTKDTSARDASLSFATSVVASPSRRLLSALDAPASFIAGTRSVALALLGW